MEKQVTTVLRLKDQFTTPLRKAGAEINTFVGDANKGNANVKRLATSLRSNLARSAVTAGKAVLTIGAALAGVALKKGLDRTLKIDEARTKLKALGNSAKDVESIMQGALKSVEGTAYGLDEAATTAASAVASGIAPGKQLQSYLTTVANTASIAGTSMSDMGAIFNKVAAKGRVDAEILNQLSDAGVPALQLLAEELGTTSSAVSDMVTRGEVDMQTFVNAMTSGTKGAAVAMGTTIKGAWSNFMASVGRLGQAFLGSSDDADTFAGKLVPLLNDMTGNVDGLAGKAEALGSKFADAFTWIVDHVSQIITVAKVLGTVLAGAFVMDKVSNAINKFAKWKDSIETARSALKKLATAENLAAIKAKILNTAARLCQTSEKLRAAATKQSTAAITLNNTAMATSGNTTAIATVKTIAHNVAVRATAVASRVAAAATRVLGTALKFLATGGGPVVLAITAIVTVAILLWKNWSRVKEWTQKVISTFLKMPVIKSIVKVIQAIIDIFKKAVDWIRNMIDALKDLFSYDGKTVNVGVNRYESSVGGGTTGRGGRRGRTSTRHGHKALGTRYFGGGLTHVNEGGRGELINLPSGTQIIPNSETKKIMNNQNQTVNVNVIVQGNMIGNEKAMREFGDYVGGRLVTALNNI